MNWTLLGNSLLVSALTTLLSVAFGFIAALWLAGLETGWRARWLAAAVVALCLPPFLVTNCWLHYLGYSGTWHRWLPMDVYTLRGTVLILTLLLWPITLFAVLGSWQRLEASQLESDPRLRGAALMRGLLWPLARGALVQAGGLTFVLALNNFAVPAVLQVKVFSAEVWVLFNTTFDSAGALKVSWPLIVVPLLLFAWFQRREAAWPRIAEPVPPRVFRRQLGKGWFWFCGGCTAAITALAVVLPLVQLFSASRTWSELPGAVAAGQSAIENSLIYALASATLCLALGFVSWRWPVGVVLWVPFLIPGVLLGIGLIAVFNRPMFEVFYQSAGIVILAYCIRYLGFGWNGVAHSMRTVDRDLTDAARLAGASRWQIFRHVHWPQISRQIIAVWYIIFLLCLWDVESMVLIMPPGGETVASRVFNLLHYGHNAQVNALCLTLLVLAIAPLVMWQAGRWAIRLKRGVALMLLMTTVIALTSCSRDNSTERTLDSKIFGSVQIIGSRGVGVGELNKPRSVAVDAQDNLYVVDMTGRVQKFSPDGKFILSWQMPQTDLGKPKGMGRDNEGRVIVVEPHYQRLNFFSPDGKLVAQWGRHGTNDGEFTMPRSVAVDSHDNIFVSEYTVQDRVQEFSHDGKKLLNLIGQSGMGPGEFNRAEGMGIDLADRLYVADSCNHRIQVFSPDGKFLRQYGEAGSGPGKFSYPYDVRVDEQGRQYVCEFGNSRIQVFDANDNLLEVIGHAGGAPGEFSNPWSIALDSKGNLYVADSQNHRVQKFLRRQPAAQPPRASANGIISGCALLPRFDGSGVAR